MDMTPPRRPSIVSNDEVIAHTLQEEFDNEAAMEASQASHSYVGSVVKQMQVFKASELLISLTIPPSHPRWMRII